MPALGRKETLTTLLAASLAIALILVVVVIADIPPKQTPPSAVSTQATTLNENASSQLTVQVAPTPLTYPNGSQTTITSFTIEVGPSTTQTCASEASAQGSCNFYADGYLDIEGFHQFYYLNLSLIARPTNFTFDGVMFNGTVNDDYCAPNATCTGPAQACVFYTALVIKNSTSYDMDQCTPALSLDVHPPKISLHTSIFLYPHNSPQVGFVWLPDGAVYILVLNK